MATKIRYNASLLILLSFIACGNCFELSDQISVSVDRFSLKHNAPFIHKNVDSDIYVKLALRAAVPSYLRDFVQVLHDKEIGDDLSPIYERLIEGIQSESCIGHSLEWISRLVMNKNLTTEKEKWVLQMIDAWGKLPEGILSGHINAYGDFPECVDIKVDDLELLNENLKDIPRHFDGRYCTTYLFDYWSAMAMAGRPVASAQASKEGKGMIGVNGAVSVEELLRILLTQKIGVSLMIPSLGVCVPSSCSQFDVQNLLVNIFNLTYPYLTGNNDSLSTQLPWPVTVACYTRHKPDFDAPVICVIILLSTLLFLGLSAGLVDYWFTQYKPEVNVSQKSVFLRYFMAFSVYTNTKKWLSTRRSPDDLGCLHGIRFLSTSWVVLAHTFGAFAGQPQWNMVDMKNIWKDWTNLAVLNATFSVDTFFVMSGMLATYNILKMLDKTNGKFNVIMFYVHRYIRLTPTYAILVGIMATLLTYAGNGPFWNSIENAEKYCRDYWWTNLLYINNLHRTDTPCNGESWYLANDMQFYILSPLIVYPIWRWELIGIILLVIYMALSCVAPVLVSRYAHIPGLMAVTGNLPLNIVEIYIRPWSRIQTFLVGIWLGWMLHKLKGRHIRLNPLISACGWLLSTGLALTVLFGVHSYFDPESVIPDVPNYFYAGLSRFTWGVVISWVIFACVKGYGGIVNSFLSWKAFMPLGRLSFCVYLTSIHLQGIFHARIIQPMRFDTYTMINLFFAHMVMSCIVGFICTLLFESPFIVLQKLIFDGRNPQPFSKPVALSVAPDNATQLSSDAKKNDNNNAI